MTAEEYCTLMLEVEENLLEKYREVLTECDVRDRLFNAKLADTDSWLAALQNENNSIRVFLSLMNEFSPADLDKTAGARNFSPEIRFTIEMIHSMDVVGTDANNSKTDFVKDCLRVQYVLEANRNIHPKALITSYSLRGGYRPSKAQPIHYARGEVVVYLRSLRL